MSDVLSFAEIEGQQVELLPARTVLSLFCTGGSVSGQTGSGTATVTSGTGVPGQAAAPTSAGVMGGPGGQGGTGTGMAGFWHNVFYIEGDMNNTIIGGQGGAADGGPATSNISMGPAGH